MKSGYQSTELGVIPSDWEVISIGEFAGGDGNIVDGPFGSNLTNSDYVATGVPVLQGLNITGDRFQWKEVRFISEQKAHDLIRSDARVGDLLTIKKGTIGFSALIDDLAGHRFAIIPANLIRVRFRGSGNPTYAFYALTARATKKRLTDIAVNTAQPAIVLSGFRRLTFSAPKAVKEQRAIAEALSDVDALIKSLDQLIAKKHDIKQAAMQQLLTGKRRLPGFNREWEMKRLGEIAQLYQPETISQSEFTDYGYPVFGANGVVGMYGRFNHQSPQITISCRGNCGTVNRTQGPAWITGNAMVVNLDATPNIDKAFVYYALAFSDLAGLVTGSGIPQIVRDPLAAFSIALPADSAEQTEIATVFSAMDAELAALEHSRDKTSALKQGMMQELLTGRTRLI